TPPSFPKARSSPAGSRAGGIAAVFPDSVVFRIALPHTCSCMLTFDQARRAITREVGLIAHPHDLRREIVPLREALERVLAEEVRADRLYPPFDRSLRDGFAVRSADAISGAKLKRIGELKAGDTPTSSVTPGTCIQIMAGAAVPQGADAVVMV